MRAIDRRPNRHLCSLRRIASCVFEKIDKDLLHEKAIDKYERQVIGQMDRDFVLFQFSMNAMERGANNLFQDMPLAMGSRRPCIQLRHLKDVVEKPIQAKRLIGHCFEQLTARSFVE